MTRTINISLDIPPLYHVDELTRQLIEYGEQLIARRLEAAEKKQYRHENLRGLLKGIDASSEELVEEYLQEKYKL